MFEVFHRDTDFICCIEPSVGHDKTVSVLQNIGVGQSEHHRNQGISTYQLVPKNRDRFNLALIVLIVELLPDFDRAKFILLRTRRALLEMYVAISTISKSFRSSELLLFLMGKLLRDRVKFSIHMTDPEVCDRSLELCQTHVVT